jgi:hypothetical protein
VTPRDAFASLEGMCLFACDYSQKEVRILAHMSGDENTKAMIHDQFRYETLSEIKKHVDKFLDLLDSLERKSYGKNLDEHPRLPLILRHNEFVKQTFLKVQSNLIAAGVCGERMLMVLFSIDLGCSSSIV